MLHFTKFHILKLTRLNRRLQRKIAQLNINSFLFKKKCLLLKYQAIASIFIDFAFRKYHAFIMKSKGSINLSEYLKAVKHPANSGGLL